MKIDSKGRVTRREKHVADICKESHAKYPEEGSSFAVNIYAECNQPQDFWTHEIRELLGHMEEREGATKTLGEIVSIVKSEAHYRQRVVGTISNIRTILMGIVRVELTIRDSEGNDSEISFITLEGGREEQLLEEMKMCGATFD